MRVCQFSAAQHAAVISVHLKNKYVLRLRAAASLKQTNTSSCIPFRGKPPMSCRQQLYSAVCRSGTRVGVVRRGPLYAAEMVASWRESSQLPVYAAAPRRRLVNGSTLPVNVSSRLLTPVRNCLPSGACTRQPLAWACYPRQYFEVRKAAPGGGRTCRVASRYAFAATRHASGRGKKNGQYAAVRSRW